MTAAKRRRVPAHHHLHTHHSSVNLLFVDAFMAILILSSHHIFFDVSFVHDVLSAVKPRASVALTVGHVLYVHLPQNVQLGGRDTFDDDAVSRGSEVSSFKGTVALTLSVRWVCKIVRRIACDSTIHQQHVLVVVAVAIFIVGWLFERSSSDERDDSGFEEFQIFIFR